MPARVLILVEGHRSNGPRYVRAARRLGLRPITLSADPAQYGYLAAENVEAIRVDTGNLDALIRECSRLHATLDIAGITGFTDLDELTYATVGKLCRHFSLPGPNSRSIEQCCDKFTQHELLEKAGVPVPACHVAASVADVEGFAAQIGLPVIVKPAAGSGSWGVRLCRNFHELAEHTTHLLGGNYLRQSSQRILVEEFAQGPFYSVDMMGTELIGVEAANFDRPPYFVFRECFFPAWLTDDEHRRIADVSLSCLRALGLGWGPTNIELRWTERGPVVIEVNPRLAGGPNPRLVQLAYGIDLITAHIKVVIGEEWDLRKKYSKSAAARFLNPDRDGILNWIDGDSRAAAMSGVAELELYVEPKTPIVRKGDYRDTIGHVIAASTSPAQTEAILQRAVDLISWSITQFPAPGQQEAESAVPRSPAQEVAHNG
ncbi:acetyl-CoA carboxylase biotin carboxylase subunit family protein [Mesorhizobium sp.]|uniref:ATP-grasp domain-containing protein n=1 Tax=Mesorhizobium sp. TaxID=1871066 RepID=UPI000FE57CDE|nr:acetyl-CoA carboxylase biotin carboxylase subunit family protein [Mesorhizobium sp.]RWP59059.1 MAG: ATP-grasp domain-containing protein [Mesorhizobium sp.]